MGGKLAFHICSNISATRLKVYWHVETSMTNNVNLLKQSTVFTGFSNI